MKIIILNIGWMNNYNGLENDDIINGGTFIGEHGFGGEIFNFSPFEGYVYGYFQPPGQGAYNDRKIRIERIGPPTGVGYIDAVLVAWVSTHAHGKTYLIGWYINATVYREWQEPPEGSNREYNGEPLGYYVKARSDHYVLLSPDQRTLEVPRASNRELGGIGQANIWYADQNKSNDLSFRQQLHQFIENYNNE